MSSLLLANELIFAANSMDEYGMNLVW